MRGAVRGEGADVEWVVARFTPLLLAQARYRMGQKLLASHDPEDVVSEVWATTLPRLAQLEQREGRATPVLVRFLSTAVLHQVNNLFRKRLVSPASDEDGPTARLVNGVEHPTRGPLTRVVRAEGRSLVTTALEELDERDREVIVLRVIEQHSNQDAAAMLGLKPNTAAQIYRRALAKLRAKLAGSVFDELAEDVA